MDPRHDRLTVSGTGILQRTGAKKGNRTLVDPGEGEHLWIVSNIYLITNPAQAFTPEMVELDIENLRRVVGPICYKCQELFSPDNPPPPTCPGSM